ncbi:hypothetical protein [Mucilaginibacter pedocola]|uniref:Uncharacterized protein n=1 Tax=Mucilaginibacter pedocola TaxID=1792845 RepID=A0A1S9PJ50_9SPHI|nr:hypothetical protein [Mucilaginibacter pedocola]OOQ60973.1 hypothetical protein BC343_21195 [Mucilaginibacter pedocola]
MRTPILTACLLSLLFNTVYGQKKKKMELLFNAPGGHTIRLDTNHIYYDNKIIFNHQYPDEVAMKFKEHRFIKSGQAVFLFICDNGAPNDDEFEVYQVFPGSAKFITKSIASPIKDYDSDSMLEFGGSNLTEVHPSRDSMYYIPSKYFEINNEKILFDKRLTVQTDKEVNGIYLAQPLDKKGICCKVIPITKAERKAERKN